jgi:hypothetical protein
MFIMSTIADGPYWPSALEPLAYPIGCSFYRPFSYQKEYVDPVLLDVLKDPKQLSTFLSDEHRNRGVFGMRMRGKTSEGAEDSENVDKYLKTFIPLRWVKLRNVYIMDSVQLSLTLGEYIGLKDRKFQPISLEGIIDFTKRETMLMVEFSGETMKSFENMAEPPDGLWKRLADDESLSPKARENFKGSTVLRLGKVTERGSTTPLTPTSLELGSKDQTYGFTLKTEKVYDFELYYNRIFDPGESHDPFLYDYKFGGPTEHFAVSREVLRITGNYRTELVWVQPKVAQPASVLLEWDGVKRTDKSLIADPRTDKIMPLRVPVMSVAHFWSGDRIRDGLATMIFLIATAFCFYLAFHMATTATIPSGTAPQPGGQAISSSVIPVLVAMGAFFAGLLGGFLKDFIRGRS